MSSAKRSAIALGAATLVLWACSTQPGEEHAIKAAVAAAKEAARTATRPDDAVPYERAVQGIPMGSVCWAAILEAVSQFGRRCVADENPDFRAALNESIARLDAHFRASGGWSDERLRAFKTQMGETNMSIESLCGNADAVGVYRQTERPGPQWLENMTEKVLLRAGPPSWGTCL